MARLTCPCGNELTNQSTPSQVEGILIKDQDMEFETELNCSEVSDLGRIVWECDKCGRLAISFPNKHDIKVKWYAPEDGIPGNLMKFD